MIEEPNKEDGAPGNGGKIAADAQPSTSAKPEGWHLDEKEHKAKECAHWAQQKRINEITLGISVLALCGAIYSAYISNSSLKAAIRAANEANRQSNAAEKQIHVAEDTEQRQLRAYLHVSHGPIEVTDTTAMATIIIGHAGATPAYELRLDAAMEVGSYLLNQEKLRPPSLPGMRHEYSVLYGMDSIKQTIAIIQPAVEAIQLIKKSDYTRGPQYAYYLHGSVRYFDIFEKERRYEFCFVFQPDRSNSEGNESGCEQYNKPG
jgi:hypothetical protein